MGAYSDKKYEEARLKQRRTLDASGLDARLKAQDEPDVATVWSEQARLKKEDTKLEYSYKKAKSEARRLKKELRKSDRQTTGEFGNAIRSTSKSVRQSASSVWRNFLAGKPSHKVAAGLVVFALVGSLYFGIIRSDNPKDKGVLGESNAQATPDFATLTPDGNIAETQSKKLSYDAQKKVASYTDSIAGVSVTISQQVMPESFKTNTVDELDKLAKQIYANEFIKGANVPAYVGTSAKGPQTAVFIKNNNLIFILSQSKIEISDWADYINSLK